MREDSSGRGQRPTPGSEKVLEPLQAVTLRQGLEPLAAQLAELRSWLADDLSELDASIRSLEGMSAQDLQSSTPHLAEKAAAHILQRPGKQIRPLCVLLAARVGGREMDSTVRDLAVACELVHTATLLHDDVIDGGEERRGAAAARLVFGNAASILAGDHLLVQALKLVRGTDQPKLLDLLLDVIACMVAAEALQLEARGSFSTEPSHYFRVVKGKTAALFRWGLVAGASVTSLDDEATEALARLGETLGVAFQLADDLLDLEGDPAVTGKSPLTDLREGKLTWPLLVAANQDDTLRMELKALVEKGADLSPAQAARILSQIRSGHALDETRQEALRWATKAQAELERLPPGRARDALALVVESAIWRVR